MNIFALSKEVKEILYDDIQIGDQAEITKLVTAEDIERFAELSGDVNPIHLLDEFAKESLFKERIAHGSLASSYISTILGTKLPGKNTIYLSQQVSFKAPVKIGDELTVIATVLSKRDDKRIITLSTNVNNQREELVVEGTAVVKKL
ncbi:MaoC family dehydratase [Neobacillus drentensis]|uniref:MaoC family dehydratase n=1 Tax=Neobacillus drentensis TaxID=220684 RepID=UPI003000090C